MWMAQNRGRHGAGEVYRAAARLGRRGQGGGESHTCHRPWRRGGPRRRRTGPPACCSNASSGSRSGAESRGEAGSFAPTPSRCELTSGRTMNANAAQATAAAIHTGAVDAASSSESDSVNLARTVADASDSAPADSSGTRSSTADERLRRPERAAGPAAARSSTRKLPTPSGFAAGSKLAASDAKTFRVQACDDACTSKTKVRGCDAASTDDAAPRQTVRASVPARRATTHASSPAAPSMRRRAQLWTSSDRDPMGALDGAASRAA
mmetsp:Transcript_14481/g.51491  ORF Transcript_14481/g.51491 Transcript_14481/m.51491 type:complete len:266 (-) Transcript_14481:1028-1825(-)